MTKAEAIERMIASGQPHYLVTPNVDFLVQARHDIETAADSLRGPAGAVFFPNLQPAVRNVVHIAPLEGLLLRPRPG